MSLGLNTRQFREYRIRDSSGRHFHCHASSCSGVFSNTYRVLYKFFTRRLFEIVDAFKFCFVNVFKSDSYFNWRGRSRCFLRIESIPNFAEQLKLTRFLKTLKKLNKGLFLTDTLVIKTCFSMWTVYLVWKCFQQLLGCLYFLLYWVKWCTFMHLAFYILDNRGYHGSFESIVLL